MNTISGFNSVYINTLDNLPFENDFNDQNYLKTDGSNTMLNNLNMDDNKIINLSAPVDNSDATNKLYVDTQINNISLSDYLKIDGSNSMTNNLNLNNNKIINLSDPVDNTDAANKLYVDTAITNELSNYVTLNTDQIINSKKFFVNPINTSFGLLAAPTVKIGSINNAGVLRLAGTQAESIIQATTVNLHLDTALNSNNNGTFINTYSLNSNCYFNSAVGSGCILMGTFSFEPSFKVSINKQSKSNALRIIGGTKIESGNLDMSNSKIVNLFNATNPGDAVNLGQLNNLLTNYVTLNSNQTITGLKQFSFEVKINTTDNKTATVLSYFVQDVRRWEAGIYGFFTNPNPDYTIKKDGITSVFSINYTDSNLNIHNNKITNLANGTSGTDAINLNQLNAAIANLPSNIMTTDTTQTVSGLKTFEPLLTTNNQLNYFNFQIGDNNLLNNGTFEIIRSATKTQGTVTIFEGAFTLQGNGTNFKNTFKLGDTITVGSETRTIVNFLPQFGEVLELNLPFNNSYILANYSCVARPVMVVRSNGAVGIGTQNPFYALDVQGAPLITFFNTGFRYGNGGAGSNVNLFINEPINVKSNSGVWATIFYATSDRRIKKNVKELDDADALQVLRKIKPVKYEYIDQVQRHNRKEYGFIAQDVQEVLPHSVRTEQDFIPNIYDLADFEIIDNKTFITLRTHKLKNIKGDLIQLIDLMENKHEYQIYDVINESCFIISTDISQVVKQKELSEEDIKNDIHENTIFIFGSKVDDVHILDKNAIYSVSVAALQQIDTIQQRQRYRINELENKVDNLIELLKSKNII